MSDRLTISLLLILIAVLLFWLAETKYRLGQLEGGINMMRARICQPAPKPQPKKGKYNILNQLRGVS